MKIVCWHLNDKIEDAPPAGHEDCDVLVLCGVAPVWKYCLVMLELKEHPAGAIAVFSQAYGGAVVVRSRGGDAPPVLSIIPV